MVNGIVDNKEGKTRKVADIRMYHVGWNYLQLGCDMVDGWHQSFYTFNQCDNLISCVLMVDDTVDGKDN